MRLRHVARRGDFALYQTLDSLATVLRRGGAARAIELDIKEDRSGGRRPTKPFVHRVGQTRPELPKGPRQQRITLLLLKEEIDPREIWLDDRIEEQTEVESAP